jgi:hypothetical protein
MSIMTLDSPSLFFASGAMGQNTQEVAAVDVHTEIELLLCCARTCIDSEIADRIRTTSCRDIHWKYLIELAHKHAVMPLLYQSLNTTCLDAIPNPVVRHLRDYFYANTGRNLFLTDELLKLLSLFERQGIAAIPYKGPTLAASIYGNLGLRQFGDLDILVHQRSYQKAQHVLLNQGYRPTIEHEWEIEFKDPSERIAVDLHKRITPEDFPSPIDFDYLAHRVEPVALAGSTVHTLCAEDTLIMLSIQVAKDGSPQLAKVCDIAELVRAHQSIDWADALSQTRRLGAHRMVLVGLSLAGNLLGTSLPQEVRREVEAQGCIRQLMEYKSHKIFPAIDSTVRMLWTEQRFRWIVRERMRDRLFPYYLSYVYGALVPNELDRRFLHLPQRLSCLYYLVRPFRLLGKYACVFFGYCTRIGAR